MGRIVVALGLVWLAAGLARAQERPDGWVVLSVEEYRELRARAFPQPPDPSPPPIDAALSRVDYSLRVGADTVAGQARLTIDVLKQGWARVRMPAGFLVRSARLDGRPVALIPGNPPEIILSQPGRAVLTLEVVIPISSAGGVETVTLPSAGAAVAAVRLTLERAGVDFAASGGVITEQVQTAGQTRWLIYGVPWQPLSLTWKRKADDQRASLPLRTRARISQLVALGEETSRVTAHVHTEIVEGTARDLALAIPSGMTISQVSGANVADWNHRQDTLTVAFLEPVTEQTSVVVHGESRLPREGTIAVPIIRAAAAERETGGIAVDVVGPGEIGARAPNALDPADPSELADVVAGAASPAMAAFRFQPLRGGDPRSLTIAVSRYTPKAVLVANIEEARYEALAGEDGKMLVRARYAVRNNQRSFLAVTLPPRAIVWSAALGERAVRPGIGATGQLLLPLAKGRTGEDAPVFSVDLVYMQQIEPWRERGTLRISLPSLDLPVSRTGLSLGHSPRYRIEVRPGVFRVASDAGPWTMALKRGWRDSAAEQVASRPAAGTGSELSAVHPESYRTLAGIVPVDVTVPSLGCAVFVTAELTPENDAPVIELEYKRQDN